MGHRSWVKQVTILDAWVTEYDRLFSLQNDISSRFNARHIITALQNTPETETVHVLSTLLERYKITAEVIRVKLIEFCHCVYEFVRVQCTYRYVSYDFGLDVKVHAAHLTLKLLVMGHSSDGSLRVPYLCHKMWIGD